MAGHLVLRNISSKDKNQALSKATSGVTWSKVYHPEVPWDATSRTELKRLLSGQELLNRNNLPPHRYLRFSWGGAGTKQNREKIEAFLISPDPRPVWMYKDKRALVQPYGEKLSADAQEAWNIGNVNRALRDEFRHGTLLIEIYYLDEWEIKPNVPQESWRLVRFLHIRQFGRPPRRPVTRRASNRVTRKR